MAVSRQLDRVRVEQNHCQGLHTDNRSYSGRKKKSELDAKISSGRSGYAQWCMPCDCRDRKPFLQASRCSNLAMLQISLG